jgi:hypothetical protein
MREQLTDQALAALREARTAYSGCDYVFEAAAHTLPHALPVTPSFWIHTVGAALPFTVVLVALRCYRSQLRPWHVLLSCSLMLALSFFGMEWNGNAVTLTLVGKLLALLYGLLATQSSAIATALLLPRSLEARLQMFRQTPVAILIAVWFCALLASDMFHGLSHLTDTGVNVLGSGGWNDGLWNMFWFLPALLVLDWFAIRIHKEMEREGLIPIRQKKTAH